VDCGKGDPHSTAFWSPHSLAHLKLHHEHSHALPACSPLKKKKNLQNEFKHKTSSICSRLLVVENCQIIIPYHNPNWNLTLTQNHTLYCNPNHRCNKICSTFMLHVNKRGAWWDTTAHQSHSTIDCWDYNLAISTSSQDSIHYIYKTTKTLMYIKLKLMQICRKNILFAVCIVHVKTPLFPGESDLDQLDKIFQLFGTPTEEAWPVRRLLFYAHYWGYTFLYGIANSNSIWWKPHRGFHDDESFTKICAYELDLSLFFFKNIHVCLRRYMLTISNFGSAYQVILGV